IADALRENAPRGEFRRQVQSHNLLSAWRANLQQRVLEHVTRWANENGVAVAQLVDHRPRPTPSRAGPAPTRSRQPGSGDVERLRAALHRVVDAMPLAELAALPVPAQYLL